MTENQEEIDKHTSVMMNLAKQKVVMDLMKELLENNYTTSSQFNGSLVNKLEELGNE